MNFEANEEKKQQQTEDLMDENNQNNNNANEYDSDEFEWNEAPA